MSSGQGAGGELWLVLQQLQSVEEQLREHIAGIHDAHKHLEDRLDSRLLEVIEQVKKQGTANDGAQAASGVAAFRAEDFKEVNDMVVDAAAPLPGSQAPFEWRSQHPAPAMPMTAAATARASPVWSAGVSEQLDEAKDEGNQDDIVPPLVHLLRTTSIAFSKQLTSSTCDAEVVASTLSVRPRQPVQLETLGVPRGHLPLPTSRSAIATMPRQASLFTFHPNSSLVRMYDLFIFILLICEVGVVPYQIAFQMTMSMDVFFAVVTYVSLACWSIDFVSGFFIGAYNKGELVMKPRMIAVLYLKRDFVINVVTLLCDIAAIVGESTIPVEEDQEVPIYLRLFKFSRLVRVCVKLYATGRAVSLASLAEFIATSFRQKGISAQVQALVQVCGALLAIALLNHLGACIWWIISHGSIRMYITETALDSSRKSEYFVAYYNSVSLMIAGQNIFTPVSADELLATVTGIYFGIVFVSIIISKVATYLIDFHIANKENSDKVRLLQKYLQQRRVAAQVAIPVEKQIFERLRSIKWLSEKDVPVLSILSPCLRVELLCSVYGSAVRQLPLLTACCCVDENLVRDICYNALAPDVLDPGYRVFEPDRPAAGAYFLSWGACEYSVPLSQDNRTSPVMSLEAHTVECGSWVSEVALWITWQHRGCLECSKTCELLRLPSSSLVQVLKHRPVLAKITQDYMRAVADAVAVEPQERLTDLKMCIDHAAIITSMPLESRWNLSEAALSMLNTSGMWVRPFGIKGLKELSNEASAGACDLIVDKDDRVKRHVNIVALRLLREDGKMLVRIAEKKGPTVVPEMVLPGTKVRGGELPASALRRLLDHQMKDLGPLVQLGHREVLVEERLSSTYGVNTTYMRTVYHGRVEGAGGAAGGLVSGAATPRRITIKREFSLRVRSMRSYGRGVDFLHNRHEVVWFADSQVRGNAMICAWMDQREFNLLTSSNMGQSAARQWVNALALDSNPNQELDGDV